MPMENQNENRMFTLRECANVIGVHPNTIKRWIFTGKIKGFKVGRYYRVFEKEFQDFILNTRYEGDNVKQDKKLPEGVEL